jgi:hypothetical protein
MKLLLSIIFFLASSTSVYFFGKLLTWIAWKIKPENFQKQITNKDILSYNIVMIISLILWSILFYFIKS